MVTKWKHMIITISDSYLTNSYGPFFANGASGLLRAWHLKWTSKELHPGQGLGCSAPLLVETSNKLSNCSESLKWMSSLSCRPVGATLSRFYSPAAARCGGYGRKSGRESGGKKNTTSWLGGKRRDSLKERKLWSGNAEGFWEPRVFVVLACCLMLF